MNRKVWPSISSENPQISEHILTRRSTHTPATPRCVSDRNHCFPAMGAGCFNGVVKPGAGGVARAYGADGVLWAHTTRKVEFSWHKFLILTAGRFFRGQALLPAFSLQAL